MKTKKEKIKRHNFNKGIKLHNVCGNNEYFPVMNYIYFDNGYAVASTGHILIKAYLKEISSFTDEEIEMLNGKLLHSDSYAELIKHNVVSVESDGFLIETDVFNMKIKFYGGDSLRFPKYEKVISDLKKYQVGEVGISTYRLDDLADSVNADKVKLTFHGENKGILVNFVGCELNNTFGLIMPFILDI